MSKILKNTTISPISIVDTGIIIPGSSQYVIQQQDYLLWAASSNIITYIGSGDIVVNDGSVDLSISDGTDLIKGIFPSLKNTTITGSLTALNSTVSTSSLDRFGTAGVYISGTWSGTITFEGSIDNTNFFSMNSSSFSSGLISSTTASNGEFRININGLKAFRVKMTSYNSGTANITIILTEHAGLTRSINNILGSTDGTPIGNVGDKLKVQTEGTINVQPGVSKKIRYIDMNAGNGGVARDTSITNASWVDIFNYSGSGVFYGFSATLEEGVKWDIRVIVDGDELFGVNGLNTSDLASDAIYDMDSSGKNFMELFDGFGLFLGSHDQFRFHFPVNLSCPYSSSVVIKVKREAGQAAKRFRGGLIIISKES